MNDDLITILEEMAGQLAQFVPLVAQIAPLSARLDRIEAQQDQIIAGLEVLGEVALRAYRATGPQESLPAEVMDAPILEKAVRRHLADIFLHGSAKDIADEPRLSQAAECQHEMERHLAAVFEGDLAGLDAARKESRTLISAALMRGEHVSVREAAPVLGIEQDRCR